MANLYGTEYPADIIDRGFNKGGGMFNNSFFTKLEDQAFLETLKAALELNAKIRAEDQKKGIAPFSIEAAFGKSDADPKAEVSKTSFLTLW